MQPSRLNLALETGALVLPPEGRIAVFRPRAGYDLAGLPADRVEVIQGFRPDHDSFAAQGLATVPRATGGYGAAIVCLPRAKAEARALIARAAATVAAGGPIAVDGQKTDGVDSVLKDLRARAQPGEALAKAHGKIAVFANPGEAAFADWAEAAPRRLAEGFVTRPAAFSADGVDPGSAVLAAALPVKLPPRVADFGAGWGYLAAEVLKRDGVAEVHLIEAEHDALEAARANIADPRARFHWADATRFVPETRFGAIVMNPPFHQGREADPGLGRAFIAATARALVPSGTLWMVANRHLPYERTLAELFRTVEELPGPPAYKIYRATGVKAAPRHPARGS
jgi:16S rRNA (guanine1207-N2)-methyltransferase